MKYAIASVLKATLPPRLKRLLIHLAYHISPDEFGGFAHIHCITPSMTAGLQLLARRGFCPATIVDVGAYEGEWTRLATNIWPSSRAIMVEANRAKLQKLRAIGETHCVLLGAEHDSRVMFNVMETGSSVFSEHSSVIRQQEERRISTFDSLNLRIDPPALLKIDTQGYELEVLKGASNSLPYFEAVLLEVALIEMNKGAPLLKEVIEFMDGLGFVACDILETHRRFSDKALSQIDVLFTRDDSELLASRPFS